MQVFNRGGRSVLLIAGALMCGALVAEESITIDRVRQRTPWNGLVDIDYTIAGVTGDPNDFQIEFTVTAGGKTFVASNFWDAAWCDHATANGPQRATWIARADGIAEETPVSVSARLIYAPVTDASAEFAIIDLSGGKDAAYPVRYVAGDTNRTAQFNIDAYKLKKLVLKKVHAGEFWMGEGNVTNGTNRHRVRLTQDYFMGLFEVTQQQYIQVRGDLKPYCEDSYSTDSYGQRASCRPVGRVLWSVAKEAETGFFDRLNRLCVARGTSVGTIDLPTEAEWEYACRAGCGTTYYYGEDATNSLSRYANYNMQIAFDASGNFYPEGCKKDKALIHTDEVGRRIPNAWGFYDMAGNVCEWCSDWNSSYPAYSETEVTEDPTGSDVGTEKIMRGGSDFRGAVYCASGYREPTKPTDTSGHHEGFMPNGWGMRAIMRLK